MLEKKNVMFAPTFKASSAKPGVWSPGSEPAKEPSPERKELRKDAGIPPVWTPSSAGASPVPEKKEFRPVQFESPILSRKKQPQEQTSGEEASPPWEAGGEKCESTRGVYESSASRIVNSHSAPSQGLNSLVSAPRLPRAQNPTITLLQKAREGQLPKGAAYLEEAEIIKRPPTDDNPLISPGEIIYTVKKEYESEPEAENESPKKMADLGPRKFEGIGPITKEGIPLVLRSEVKENNQTKWYKKMYDSLHRADRHDDYVTIRYKPRRGTRYGYGSSSGYLSEPEPRIYSDRSATLDSRRRLRNKENDYSTSTMPRKNGPLKYSSDVYKNQPGRIEDYEPGRSSIAEKEAKEWWDEVMDIFDGPFDQRGARPAKPYMSHALKESGYESDSTLVFRRKEDISPLSVLEQRLAYKTVQSGGDVPLHGLRKPAPERPKGEYLPQSYPSSLLQIDFHYFYLKPAPLELIGNPRSSCRLTSFEEPLLNFLEKLLEFTTTSEARVIGRETTTILTTSAPLKKNQHQLPRKFELCPEFHGERLEIPEPQPTRTHTSPLSTDDKGIEFFPISPTLTRIRVHRQISSSMIFSRYKRSVPSLASSISPLCGMECRPAAPRQASSSSRNIVQPLTRPPSPPRRRSSRDSKTLKLYSRNVETTRSRHEQCFRGASSIRSLREKFCSNLERQRRAREQCIVTARTSSSSPVSTKSRYSLDKRRSEPCLSRGLTETGRFRACSSASPSWRATREACALKPEAKEDRSSRLSSRHVAPSVGSRGRECLAESAQRRKEISKGRLTRKEQEESSRRLSRSSADLSSVVDGKRSPQKAKDAAQTRILPSGTVVKSSTTLYTSTLPSGKQRNPMDKSLKVVVAITSKGQEILRKSEPKIVTTSSALRTSCKSSSPPTLRRNMSSEAKKQRAPAKQQEKLVSSKECLRSVASSSSELTSEANKRKRPREKPQTIVRSPIRKPETLQIDPEGGRKKVEPKKRSKKCPEIARAKKPAIGEKQVCQRREKANLENREPNLPREEEIPRLTVEVLRKHREATRSDTFFQNLFLRSIPSPSSTQNSALRRSLVSERTKKYQEITKENYRSEPSLKSLSVYLAQKRPVSNSRFKTWERESLSSRSSSPCGVRSVLQKVSRFDSLLGIDEFGSSGTLHESRSPDSMKERLKERSSSEPPLKTLPENTKIEESDEKRPRTPSPGVSTDGKRVLGWSSRKIRARSAGEVEDRRERFGSNLSLARSASSVCTSTLDREEYHRYVLELLHCRRKSKRYKDLRDFYSSLERMGELERTFSSTDLRPRLRNEEIIDYDRWKMVRSKEKAELELNALYGKLRAVQRDKDFLFSTRDLDKYKWQGDCGLRCKERSVENILQGFKKLQSEESELESSKRRDICSRKDTYKPLWRGVSVVNVANTMQKKAQGEQDAERSLDHPSLQKSLGGSKKFWSSLSIEQVATLKKQLNEIYGSDNLQKASSSTTPKQEEPREIEELPAESRKSSPLSSYEILVPPESEFGDFPREEGKGLHVRCHSMIGTDEQTISTDPNKTNLQESTTKRRGSIGQGKTLERSDSERKPSMSELEKKRLSLTLGKEVLDKVTQRRQSIPLAPRETRGSIAAALAATKIPRPFLSPSSTSPRSCYSLEPTFGSSKEKNDFLLVLTPNDESVSSKRRVENVLEEWSRKPPLLAISMPDGEKLRPISMASGSEMDSTTGSSETSVKTVVQRSIQAEQVPKKIEFFEQVERKDTSAAPREPSRGRLSSSRSFADLKELFGETQIAKYCGGASFRSRSASPCRGTTRSNSSSCSLESFRHRSASPDPERYWRAYLKLARNGTVRRLRARFESAEELSTRTKKTQPRRFQSDPELARCLLKKIDEGKRDSGSSKEVLEGILRRRQDGRRIPKVPLKRTDLSMPRIDVISKTAELKDSVSSTRTCDSSRREETKELEAKRPVGRMRSRFEAGTSILGEMFTSSPDVHELRDIAPYLAGSWVAHRYPSRRDNTRSLSSPPDLEKREVSSGCKDVTSMIPGRMKARGKGAPSSILKPKEMFADQAFDPEKHRPRFRYQPPPSPKASRKPAWCSPIPLYTARPTVTFEGLHPRRT
ncbi:hypothetical protein KM043_014664 [Ampulex compressa]|nr:hypothetical protein KM043_014664 [Ampulex compressa]